MATQTSSLPLSRGVDPLSYARAAFNGHSVWAPPRETILSEAEGSKDAQARARAATSRGKVHENGWDAEDYEREQDGLGAEAVKPRESCSSIWTREF